ncbi:MAG: hypothetical protein JWR10_845 [Rubritepida sp.]|nr:hypothetical protein [Rubritepida sp.]
MPIQEALVWQKSQIPRPAGVLFDPPCKTRAQDLTSWNALVPAMKNEIGAGRYIMVLVQTRNTRSWVVNDMQYTYKADEDYVVASFSLAATMGTSYTPGTVAHA